jgi:NADPH:quinone reductase-like Zn-dependent oxidoreductase
MEKKGMKMKAIEKKDTKMKDLDKNVMKMKAIVCTKYGPPDVLQLMEADRPSPGDNEVLVRIRATAVTSSDCYVRGLNLPALYRMVARIALGFRKPRQPILGMVFAGEVEEVGGLAGLFKIGDRVFGIDRFAFGTYAEYKCMPEDGVLAMMPQNATYAEAAALPYGGTLALSFLRDRIQVGQKVLVYGASGAVGSIALQLAKYYGAYVAAVCSSANLDLVKSLGADEMIDYSKEDVMTRGETYDITFDAVGKRKSKGVHFVKILSPNGKCISVDDGSPKLHAEDLILIRQLMEEGRIKPVIDRVYPLEEIVEAHRYVDKGHKKGNVVIHVG